jgi:hypothetical protein
MVHKQAWNIKNYRYVGDVSRVRNIGYLLWEWLGDGDVEAVSADVEEGAVVVEVVLEAGENCR